MTLTARFGTLAAALALLAAVFVIALQPAEAGNFRERVSGNFIDTSLDTAENDGMAASSFSGATSGNGSATYEGLLEVDLMLEDPPGACEDEEIEGAVATYSMVRRYANGDLLISELVDGSLCFDPNTGLSTLTVNAQFVGGTGKYEHAAGTYTATYNVRQLIPDPMGGIAHGIFWGETSGTN